jgi:hypothetical protein
MGARGRRIVGVANIAGIQGLLGRVIYVLGYFVLYISVCELQSNHYTVFDVRRI